MIINYSEWENHPFLSRLTGSSDAEGDFALNIKDWTLEDQDYASKVDLEYLDSGTGEWKKSIFVSESIFRHELRIAWYGPVLGQALDWRAKIDETDYLG